MVSKINFTDFVQNFVTYFTQNWIIVIGLISISIIISVVRCHFWRETHSNFVHRGDYKYQSINIEMLRKLPELFHEKFYSKTMTDEARFEFINEYYHLLRHINASILQRGFTEGSLEEYNLADVGKQQFLQCLGKWIVSLIVILIVVSFLI